MYFCVNETILNYVHALLLCAVDTLSFGYIEQHGVDVHEKYEQYNEAL